jgi:hypothetical protein
LVIVQGPESEDASLARTWVLFEAVAGEEPIDGRGVAGMVETFGSLS